MSKPAATSAVVPPQSTACSPKRSVSVSSVNVVSMTPARVPPMPFGVGEGERERAAGRVLLDRDQARHALAVGELAADQVAGALRGDHRDVHVRPAG